MSDHLHTLWDQLDLPEAWPQVDHRNIRKRVDVALDCGKPRRRRALPIALACSLTAVLCSLNWFLSNAGQALPPAPVPSVPPPDTQGWTIVRTLEQYDPGNPTRDRTGEIHGLPVYASGPLSPEAQSTAADRLADALNTSVQSAPESGRFLFSDGTELTFSPLSPQVDITSASLTADGLLTRLSGGADVRVACSVHCSFDGTLQSETRFFPFDSTQALSQQFLDFSFSSVLGLGDGFRLSLLPPQLSEACPIRSAEEAVSRFRAGDYFSVTTLPEQAEIQWVQLIYRIDDTGAACIQPFYEIVYTQDYWDLTGVMEADAAAQCLSVSSAYVPALADSWQEEFPPSWHINDCDTGHGRYAAP